MAAFFSALRQYWIAGIDFTAATVAFGDDAVEGLVRAPGEGTTGSGFLNRAASDSPPSFLNRKRRSSRSALSRKRASNSGDSVSPAYWMGVTLPFSIGTVGSFCNHSMVVGVRSKRICLAA